MRKAVALAIIGVVMACGLAWAGEKEDLALRIFMGQEDAQNLQDDFKKKQGEYQALRQALKKEGNQEKKGRDAVRIIELETELIALSEKVQKKAVEVNEAREKYKALGK